MMPKNKTNLIATTGKINGSDNSLITMTTVLATNIIIMTFMIIMIINMIKSTTLKLK